MMKEMDEDGGGDVDFEEFYSWFTGPKADSLRAACVEEESWDSVSQARPRAVSRRGQEHGRGCRYAHGQPRSILSCPSLCPFRRLGNVPFFALDTLLQFPRFEKVPPEDKEAVRERFFWGLEHEDLGMCTLGAWGIEHTNQPAFLQTEDEVSQHCSLPRGRTGDDGAGGVETDREWCWRGSTSGSQVC